MPFVIKTEKGYVKRTSNFGMFHGNVVLTNDEAEAFRFTRMKDAIQRADVLVHRTRPITEPAEGEPCRWYHGHAGFDHVKFGGQLSCEILEV